MNRPRIPFIVATLLGLVIFAPVNADQTLVAKGAAWRYLDTGTDQGVTWRTSTFDDSPWAQGSAQLGYGDGDETTTVGYGPNSSAKYITTYFRKRFDVADASLFSAMSLKVLRDDGVVVYLNGTEVWRNNLPTGAISYGTVAPTAITGAEESTTFIPATLQTTALQTGSNVLAVEIHQQSGTSSDISFDLELIGLNVANPVLTRGPYLQNVHDGGITLRWRTDLPTDSRVRFGTSASALTQTAGSSTQTTEHEVTLTGLAAETQYYYAVGSVASGDLVTGSEFSFRTAPAAGTRKPLRFWVLGDAGTGTAGQINVRNAYYTRTGAQTTDLVLLLGDNAYSNGTDAEYQSNMFAVYPNTLRNTPSFSTIGNHDTAGLASPDITTTPYFGIFNHPTAAEGGGVASGTEKYYSFDYGNVHFVSLDSMTSSRAPDGAMATWLTQDLAQNTQDWLIVFFHHPPYTKGSHDSDNSADSGGRMGDMRANLLPILEANGVDLVLSGHSHSYERSYLLDGHYGLSSTLTTAMKLDPGDGRELGNGVYEKAGTGPNTHQGAVYVVPGSAGQASGGTLNHPAMHISLNTMGSFVVAVDGDRLDASFITDLGAEADTFSIVKGTSVNTPPSVSITQPTASSQFTAGASVALAATASDADGLVSNVAFYVDGTLVGSDSASPWTATWIADGAGTRTITAVATDDGGATATSAGVTVNVSALPTGPSSLSATSPSRKKIVLNWTDNASNESGFQIDRSPNGSTNWSRIATTGVDVKTYTNSSGLTSGRSYWYRVRAYNANGVSAWSNTASATSR